MEVAVRRLATIFWLAAAACAHRGHLAPQAPAAGSLPPGFVYLDQVDPSIVVELRYATAHNFIGEPLPGYGGGRAVLTEAAARALAAVQTQLRPQALSLKIYDAYRPEKAVQRCVQWLQDDADRRMQAEFYPREDKVDFLEHGFLAERSSHSRGSAVDVTLVPLPVPPQATYVPGDALVDGSLPKGLRFDDNSVDMGTNFDTFDPLSRLDNSDIGELAYANRALLRQAMQAHGFLGIEAEWWHFALESEPFPETYYDFDLGS